MNATVTIHFMNVDSPVFINCMQEDKPGIITGLLQAMNNESLFYISNDDGVTFIIRATDVRAIY